MGKAPKAGQPLHSPGRLHCDRRMVVGQHVSIGAPLTAVQLRGIAARHWPGARLATECVIRFIFYFEKFNTFDGMCLLTEACYSQLRYLSLANCYFG